jgi:hypothetical protein
MLRNIHHNLAVGPATVQQVQSCVDRALLFVLGADFPGQKRRRVTERATGQEEAGALSWEELDELIGEGFDHREVTRVDSGIENNRRNKSLLLRVFRWRCRAGCFAETLPMVGHVGRGRLYRDLRLVRVKTCGGLACCLGL